MCRSSDGNAWEILTGAYKKRDCLATILPTRAIDVGSSEKAPSLFISQGAFGQWVALSHCWGQHQPLILESKSISAFIDGIQLETMPPMFQDAVFITRRLGFRYLWIDCLCIVQGSREDWLRESLEMGGIYKIAVVTIAAEAAENGSAGILSSTGRGRTQEGVQNPQDVLQVSSFSTAHSIKGSLILTTKSAMKTGPDARGPLSARKWVLQEEILSSRLLRFAGQLVWWQCRELQCNERFPFGYRASNGLLSKNNIRIQKSVEWSSIRSFILDSKRGKTQKRGNNKFRLITNQHIRWYWYDTVNEYCMRHMTYDADSLPAISDIAKEYRRQLSYSHKSYKAGIWLDDLPQGLLWYTRQPGATTASPYVAPSWSWASMRSGPYCNRRLLEDLIPDETFTDLFRPRQKPRGIALALDTDLTMRQVDPFGQVEGGFIRLRGPCHDLCRCSIPVSFFDYFTENEDTMLDYLNVQNMLKEAERSSKWTNICSLSSFVGRSCELAADIQHRRCLIIHVISSKPLVQGRKIAFALILEQLDDTDNGYRRIRLAILSENIESSKLWPTRDITIF